MMAQNINVDEKLTRNLYIISEEECKNGQFGTYQFDLKAKPIAEGAFGKVWQDKTKKYVLKSNDKTFSQENQKGYEHSLKEISVIAQCNHRYIVKFYAAFSCYTHQNGRRKKFPNLWFVMEHAGCTLDYVIWNDQDNRGFPEHEALHLVRQMASALKYLRENHLIHRDIKPNNILYRNKCVKLGDFGIASDEANVMKSNTGTVKYMAPEAIAMIKYPLFEDKHSVDLYSLGATVFEMVNGIKPNHWKNADFVKGLNSAWNIKLSCNCKNFVSGLLQPDQESRFTFDTFIIHPWLGYAKK